MSENNNMMEQYKHIRDNDLANIIRLADNIKSVAKDVIQGYSTSTQGKDEILKYVYEIKKIVEKL